MSSAIHGIDHVVIAVRDLDASAATYARLGFTLTPRALHSTGSQNHCIMLGRDYLELLGLPPKAVGPWQTYFAQFLSGGEGLGGFALASFDADAARHHLQVQGFAPEAVQDLSRAVDDPAAKLKGIARFRLVTTPSKLTPGAQVFVAEHKTRPLVWAPAYKAHANTAFEIAALSMVTDNVASTASTYARVFGTVRSPMPKRIDEGLLVETGMAPISFSTRAALQARLRGVGLAERSGTFAAALWIRVQDRAATQAHLERYGVKFTRLSDGSLAVDAAQANGVAIIFGA